MTTTNFLHWISQATGHNSNETYVHDAVHALEANRRSILGPGGNEIRMRSNERGRSFMALSAIAAWVNVMDAKQSASGSIYFPTSVTLNEIAASTPSQAGQRSRDTYPITIYGQAKRDQRGILRNFFFNPAERACLQGKAEVVQRAAAAGVDISTLITPDEANSIVRARLVTESNLLQELSNHAASHTPN